jgi:hypothetical protein
MSGSNAAVARTSTLGLASWCFYDWANSAFPTIGTTFIFAVYFTKAVADNPVDGAVQWSHSVTAAALIVAFTDPALGSIPLFLFTPDRSPTGLSSGEATNGLNPLFAFGGIFAAVA